MRAGVWGAAVLTVIGAIAVLAPLIAPYSPYALSGVPLESPGPLHWLGTNSVGQDIFSQLIFGARVSLVVGAAVAAGATLLGGGIGMIAGYCGGRTDAFMMRFIDVFLAIPHLPLMLLLATYFSPGLRTVIMVLILFSWAGEARMVRAQVLSLKKQEYLEAAKMNGAGGFYLMRRYLAPDLAPLFLSQAILRAGWGILAESGLAFLGLGDPTTKSWGMMLKQAMDYQGIYFTPAWQWWLLPPGLSVTALILAFTALGYALEEKYNPALKEGV